MGYPGEPEFPAILPAGFIDLDLRDLEARCVTPFTSSRRRPVLLRRLRVLFDLLRANGLSCEAWLDGSFLTEKPEPDDIDVTLLTDNSILGRLSSGGLDNFNYLIDNHLETKARFLCDLYSIDRTDFHDRAYWRGLFGFSRADIPKGIARVQL